MAQGKRNLGGLPAWDALDSLIARLRRGESLERCLEEYPDLADELRPLAYVVAELEDAKPEPAPRPAGLERGRERLLAAAAESREVPALGAMTTGDLLANGSVDPDDPELAALLRPARRLEAVPGEALARMRSRFLEAAAAARAEAELVSVLTPAHAVNAVPVEALARVRERFLIAAEAKRMDEQFVAAMQPAHVMDEVPADALARMRTRFLDAAAAMQTEGTLAKAPLVGVAAPRAKSAAPRQPHSETNEPFGEWLGRLFGGPLRLRPAAMALAGMAVALVVMFSFSPVAAESLPGDMLYPVKRFGEQVRLMSRVWSPDRYRDVAADIESERLREVDRLVSAGRETEVSLRGRLAAFSESTKPGEEPHGELSLDISGKTPETRVVAWDTDTKFDAGSYRQFSAVPKGTLVQVTMRTNSEGHPLAALKVAVRESGDDGTLTPTATITGTAMATVTVTLETPMAPAITETPTATKQVAPLLPSPSATISVSRATATIAVTNTVEGTPTADVERPRNEARLLGVVLAMPDRATWRLRRLRDNQKSEVTVDVSPLAGDAHLAEVQVGFQVELVGRWKTRNSVFLATGLKSAKPTVCQTSREEFEVVAVQRDPGGAVVGLTLANGSTYSVGPQVAASAAQQVAVGDMVAVTVQTCPYLDGPQITALDVTGKADEKPRQTLQGVVGQLSADQKRFILTSDSGKAQAVVVTAGTAIKGGSGRLRDGQLVTVVAVEAGSGELEALTITILAEPPPTATPSPTASTTPQPTVQSAVPEPTKSYDPPPATPTPVVGSYASLRVPEAPR